MIDEVKKIAEQQTTGKQVAEEVKEPVEAPVEEKVEEVKDRTAEQFEKLKEHNKQLAEEVKVLRENVLESLKPKQVEELAPQVIEKIDESIQELGQDKVDDVFADLIDENGYLDDKMLKSTLTQLVNEAKIARKEAEEAKRKALESEERFKSLEENKEVKRVHKKYPQIDPNSDKFNENFWDDVRKEIATAPILRGETLTFEQAADLIWQKKYNTQPVKQETTVVDPKAQMIEDAKRNINAVRNNSFRSDYYTEADTDELIKASQLGKKGAIAERLRRAGL